MGVKDHEKQRGNSTTMNIRRTTVSAVLSTRRLTVWRKETLSPLYTKNTMYHKNTPKKTFERKMILYSAERPAKTAIKKDPTDETRWLPPRKTKSIKTKTQWRWRLREDQVNGKRRRDDDGITNLRPQTDTVIHICKSSSAAQVALILILLMSFVPSVLWRCWLGVRKGIRPVKIWLMLAWLVIF